MACASPGLRDVESSSYRCSVAGYRRGAEMRIRLVDLLSALLLEVISGQYPELTTAVEEQDSE